MNRLSRDEILHRGLTLADIPSLDQHDRPRGVIVEGAYSIAWLQDGLDLAHHLWPTAGLLKQLTIAFVVGQQIYSLASDHVEDKRDGLILSPGTSGVSVSGQAFRTNLEELIRLQSQAQSNPTQFRNVPTRYVCIPPDLYTWPIPDRAYGGTLWYYSLPTIMTDGAKVPTFPSDFVLVEYVRLRAQEHSHLLEPGVSIAYMKKAIGDLHTAGLGNEAEIQGPVPLDRKTFGRMREIQPGDWMGDTVPH